MLLELAIGDAYGAAFEYSGKAFIQENNNLKQYYQHPRHLAFKPGLYTDDTQMSLAIAEMICENLDWTPLNLANKYVEAFKRDERQGYAGGFYAFLKMVNDGQEFLDKIRPESDKSGAAMRAPIIGIYKDKKEVLYKTEVQAVLTHNTKDGVQAAQAAAMIVHYFLWEQDKKSLLPKYLSSNVKGDWLTPWTGKVLSKGWMSVRAAITSLVHSSSMTELLKSCIAWTGDVDTVATVALAGGSICQEIEQDLPDFLITDLENGLYGRDYIIGLDRELMALYIKE